MKKLFLTIFCFLLGVTVLRFVINPESKAMTFSSFLRMCSTIDLSFSNVLSVIANIDFRFDITWSTSWWENIGIAFQVIVDVIITPFELIFALIGDLLSFLASIISVFTQLLGVNPFTNGSPVPSGGSGDPWRCLCL